MERLLCLFCLCLIYDVTSSQKSTAVYHTHGSRAEWTQVGPSESDFEQILEDSSAQELNNYIFPNLTCVKETELTLEILARLLPTRIRYRWPAVLNKISFRTSATWSDRKALSKTQGYPHNEIANKKHFGPTSIITRFAALFLLLFFIVLLVVIPLSAVLFFVLTLIFKLLTNRAIRRVGRTFLIQLQKMKRRLEIARTPNRFPLEPPYILPHFFRKDGDDEYPEELEDFDLQLKRANGRMQSEIKIADRFGNYMQKYGLEYDSLLQRFRYRHEELPKDEGDAADLKKRLKAQLVQQARELLAQEEAYMTDIPVYRLKALELGIPYAEDEERSVILTTLKRVIPAKRSKPSALNVIPKVIKPPSKKSSKSSSRQ